MGERGEKNEAVRGAAGWQRSAKGGRGTWEGGGRVKGGEHVSMSLCLYVYVSGVCAYTHLKGGDGDTWERREGGK